MGRRREKVSLTTEQWTELELLWEKETDERVRKRLAVIRAATVGLNTHRDLAEIAGCTHTTVTRYLKKFEEGGFAGAAGAGQAQASGNTDAPRHYSGRNSGGIARRHLPFCATDSRVAPGETRPQAHHLVGLTTG